MPAQVTYEGQAIGSVVIESAGPNEGGKTTHWCRCTICNTWFLRKRSVIQQALKHDRHICPICKVKKARSSRKSYEGKEVGCVLVQEAGTDDGRRTTHWCLCRTTNQRFLKRSNTIQQAIRRNRQVCPYCRKRPERRQSTNLIGRRFGLITVKAFAGRRGKSARSSEDYWACVCECDLDREFVVAGRSLLRGRTRSCGCLSSPDLTGQHFGRLTVVRPGGQRVNRQRSWQCQCSCPNQSIVERTTAQLRGKRASWHCGCVQSARMTEWWAKKRRPVEEMARYRIYLSLKNSAKRRGLGMTLTLAEITEITRQPCYYCGARPSQVLRVPITSHPGPGGTRYIHSYHYSSVDRIDNSLGYERENVVSCCLDCQIAKGQHTCSEFALWIARLHGRLPDLYARFLHDERRKANGQDIGENYVDTRLKTARHRAIKLVFQQIKQNSRKRNIAFNITESDVEALMFRPCSYCGAGLSCAKRIPVTRGDKLIGYRRGRIRYNSVDRVDNSKGYERDNIASACQSCQFGKNDLTLMEFFELIERLGRNLEKIRKLA